MARLRRSSSAPRGGAQPAAPRRGRRGAAVGLPADLVDDVDKFHTAKAKAGFDSDDDGQEEFSELEEDEVGEGVFNLDDDDEDEEGDEEEGDDEDEDLDSEDELEAAEQRGGDAGKLAQQARLLRARLKLEQGEGSEEDEEDEDEAAAGRRGGKKAAAAAAAAAAAWGGSKRAYYGEDEEGVSSEDEEAEEQEAVRLQREAAEDLRPEDFDEEEEEEDEDEEEDEEGGTTMGQMAGQSAGGGRQVERVTRDLGSLGQQARAEALLGEAPELLALLDELKDALQEVRSRVGPLLNEVREGGLATSEGVSYLEAKHTLLLQYCAHLVFYLMLKAEGRPVKDHPVIARLVQIRTYLERVRPIDKKLSYQMDRLLAAARASRDEQQAAAAAATDGHSNGLGGGAEEDPLRYGPQPSALVAKVAAGASAAGDDDGGLGGGLGGAGVYKPPRLNPVAMEGEGGDVDRDPAAREKRRAKHLRQKAARSEMVRELMEEVEGAPEELRTGGLPVLDSAAAIREAQRRTKIQEVEEELMTRIVLSKEERRRLKALKRDRQAASAGGLVDGFDDLADLVEMAAEDLGSAGRGGGGAELQRSNLLSQRYGADLTKEAAKRLRSGDDDLPGKQPLATRRAAMDATRARQHNMRDGGGGGFSGDDNDRDRSPDEFGNNGGGGKRQRGGGGEEDEFYAAAKAAAVAKKQKRKEAYERPELLPPMEDERAGGARRIGRTIEKNRGLTPHRRKDLKNPRKKHRIKFADATKRRKGQVQEVQTGGGERYGGESTGINTRVSKSVRF